MKDAIVNRDSSVNIRDVAVPKPQPGQVLIQVVVSGINQKDWKFPRIFQKDDSESINQGDDIAGYVAVIGEGVRGFQKGDRVAAMHEMRAPHGSFAEYAIAWDYCVFHLPDHIAFEEAATIPMTAMVAALALYQRLELPLPWNPMKRRQPLLIYGASSAVGAYAVKLARLSNIHPIIAIAGNGTPFVESLLDNSAGDIVLNYKEGEETLISKINAAAEGKPIEYVVDAISQPASYSVELKVVHPGAVLASVLWTEVPDGITNKHTMVGTIHDPPSPVSAKDIAGKSLGDPEFAAAMYQFFGRGLSQGWFTPHPHQLVEGGLDGLSSALKQLESGKVSSTKLVLKIAESKGISQSDSPF